MPAAVTTFYIYLRQWRYPKAFRIDHSETDWLATVKQALSEALRLQDAEPGVTNEEDGAGEQLDEAGRAGDSEGISKHFAVGLCNEYFRLTRNAAQMEQDGVSSRELRGIQRSLNKMEDLLKEHTIECRDLTGQAYDDGRIDFEPLAPPEPVPGLEREEITLCECPAVFVDEKLLQRARGIVGTPA